MSVLHWIFLLGRVACILGVPIQGTNPWGNPVSPQAELVGALSPVNHKGLHQGLAHAYKTERYVVGMNNKMVSRCTPLLPKCFLDRSWEKTELRAVAWITDLTFF